MLVKRVEVVMRLQLKFERQRQTKFRPLKASFSIGRCKVDFSDGQRARIIDIPYLDLASGANLVFFGLYIISSARAKTAHVHKGHKYSLWGIHLSSLRDHRAMLQKHLNCKEQSRP